MVVVPIPIFFILRFLSPSKAGYGQWLMQLANSINTFWATHNHAFTFQFPNNALSCSMTAVDAIQLAWASPISRVFGMDSAGLRTDFGQITFTNKSARAWFIVT